MADMETISSYLVKLGFDVDKKSMDKSFKAVTDFVDKTNQFTDTLLKNLGKAATKISNVLASTTKTGVELGATFAAINAGIAKFVSGIGESEIGVEKLASQLYVSYDRARNVGNVLKTMHASIEELYRSPTLMRRFQELDAFQTRMSQAPDYRNQLALVQEVTTQFLKFRLMLTTFGQEVVYQFAKINGGSLKEFSQRLTELNDKIQRNMPNWAHRVAEWIWQFVDFDKQVYHILQRFEDKIRSLPEPIKKVGEAIAGVGLVLRLGGIGKIGALLSGIIYLIDDFHKHVSGEKSNTKLAPIWDRLRGFFEWFQQSGLQQHLVSDIERIGSAFVAMFEKFGEHVNGKQSLLERFTETVIKLLDALTPSIEHLLTDVVPQLLDKVIDLADKFATWLSQGDNAKTFVNILGDMAEGMIALKIATVLLFNPLSQVFKLFKGIYDVGKGIVGIGKGIGKFFGKLTGAGTTAEAATTAEAGTAATESAVVGTAAETAGATAATDIGAGALAGSEAGPVGILVGAAVAATALKVKQIQEANKNKQEGMAKYGSSYNFGIGQPKGKPGSLMTDHLLPQSRLITNNNTTNTNSGNFNVNVTNHITTTADPTAVGDAVGDSVKDQWSRINYLQAYSNVRGGTR